MLISTTQAGVPDDMTAYITDKVGAQCVDDFLGLVPSDTYQSALADVVNAAGSPGKDKLIVLAKVRTAYREALDKLQLSRKRKAEGLQDDLDHPLDAGTQEPLSTPSRLLTASL